MLQNGLNHVGVILHAQLVRHRQQQRICFGNRLILLQLFDQLIRLSGVAAAKNSAGLSSRKPIESLSSRPEPKYLRSRSFIRAKMLRLTETRGVRVWPACAQASR
jgi:hypothetical protein